jgi:UDP-N-acetyl-D-galactosamine dehydrogenase
VIPEDAEREYGIKPVQTPQEGKYDAIVIAVAHREFYAMGAEGIRRLGKQPHILYDVKYVLDKQDADMRL